MPEDLKYIFDQSGTKKSVLVPIKVWEDLNSSYQKLQAKMKVFTNIQMGLKEVKSAKRSGKKLQTLNDFLK